MLHKIELETVLGSMIAIADQEVLYLLEFVEGRGVARDVEALEKSMQSNVVPGRTPPLISIEKELKAYFNSELTTFKTPFCLLGTSFQQLAWNALSQIPYGETRSYADQAYAIGKPSAHRAVANANGANQLAIIIPCHRIVRRSGELGGYAGGVHRKKWLITHENSTLIALGRKK